MRILVDGGAGYVGSALVPCLLHAGHEVRCLDLGWFGTDHLPHGVSGFEFVQGDIRDAKLYRECCEGMEAVVHMACVSNDNSCQLDEALSTSINLDAFEPMVLAAKDAGVRRYVYCSSSSVYGTSDAAEVREDHTLLPLTLYNRYKGMCEPILWKHTTPEFEGVILRPATVCGPAPRMRFDLTVNVLTMHAITKRVITVHGGEQRRPNLDIRDMCRAYETVLSAPPESVAGQTFNVGHSNHTLMETAVRVKDVVEREMPGELVRIDIEDRRDHRSYHVNSDKIAAALNFRPLYPMEESIRNICQGFRWGEWPDALDNPIYTNVVQLIGNGLGRPA